MCASKTKKRKKKCLLYCRPAGESEWKTEALSRIPAGTMTSVNGLICTLKWPSRSLNRRISATGAFFFYEAGSLFQAIYKGQTAEAEWRPWSEFLTFLPLKLPGQLKDRGKGFISVQAPGISWRCFDWQQTMNLCSSLCTSLFRKWGRKNSRSSYRSVWI